MEIVILLLSLALGRVLYDKNEKFREFIDKENNNTVNHGRTDKSPYQTDRMLMQQLLRISEDLEFAHERISKLENPKKVQTDSPKYFRMEVLSRK
jgi:hypothetical protein